MEKAKKVFLKKNSVFALVVLLAMLFPGVVFSSLPISQETFNLKGNSTIVANSCEGFKEGECIVFEDLKDQALKDVNKLLESIESLIFKTEAIIEESQQTIAVIEKHRFIELDEVRDYLEKRLVREEEIVIRRQNDLSFLDEMFISCKEILNSLQNEVTEPRHFLVWEENVSKPHLEIIKQNSKHLNEGWDKEKSPINQSF